MANKLVGLLICLMSCLAWAGQDDLQKVVQQTINLNSIVNKGLGLTSTQMCLMYNEPPVLCPQVLIDEVVDNNRLGLVGMMSKFDSRITGGSDFSTPNIVCQNVKPSPVSLEKEVTIAFDGQRFNCQNFLEANPSTMANSAINNDYVNSFLLDKKFRLEKNLLALMAARTQIDLMIGADQKSSDCHQYQIKGVQEACQQISQCTKKDDFLFNKKLDGLFETVEFIRRLKAERYHGSHAKEVDQAIDSLIKANPILASKELAQSYADTGFPMDKTKFSLALRRELVNIRKTAMENLKKNNRAFLCLSGSGLECDDFSEIVRTSFAMNLSGPTVSDSYLCLENIKAARDEANAVLNDAAISALLSFTPMAGVGLGKILYQGGHLIKTAAKLELAKNTVVGGAVAADALYAANEIQKLQKSCEEKIKNLQQAGPVLSCQQQEKQVHLETDAALCSSQVLTAGLSSLGPAMGVVAMASAKSVAPQFVALVKGNGDDELVSMIDDYIKTIPDASMRQTKLKDLEVKAVSLLNSSESYSKEEIRNGLKVLLKHCISK